VLGDQATQTVRDNYQLRHAEVLQRKCADTTPQTRINPSRLAIACKLEQAAKPVLFSHGRALVHGQNNVVFVISFQRKAVKQSSHRRRLMACF